MLVQAWFCEIIILHFRIQLLIQLLQMFTSKIYDCLKQYLDRYLFGFDQNQLNMSILKGNINLSKVNIRPDELNKVMDGLLLPFSLKAGMIGNLHIKLSLMSTSLWNNPIELGIDDLFLIMGPNLSFLSHDESYIQEDVSSQHDHGNNNQLDESYDSTNVYNIFDHELQIKKKPKNIDKASTIEDPNDPSGGLKANLRSVLKNLKLTINRLHIRFEDDYFSSGENRQWQPFSIGLVLDKLELSTSDTEWHFQNIMKLAFQRVHPSNAHREAERLGLGDTIIKELNITGFRVYYKDMSEMFIPTSLWESTRHLENQIFDAMPVDSLNDLMKEVYNPALKEKMLHIISDFDMFASFYHFKASSQQSPQDNNQFSFFGTSKRSQPQTIQHQQLRDELRCNYLLTPLDISVTPAFINDLTRLLEFFQNFSISLDLKQYRPQRRPMIINPRQAISDQLKRKKRLLVRDWFFYVVWYIRLKRLLMNYYCSEQLLEKELEVNKGQYEGILNAYQGSNQEETKEHIKQSLLSSDKGSLVRGEEKIVDDVSLRKSTIKVQAISIKVYGEDLERYRSRDKVNIPIFEAKFQTSVYEGTTDLKFKEIQKKIMLESISLFYSVLEKSSNLKRQQQVGRNTNQALDNPLLFTQSNVNIGALLEKHHPLLELNQGNFIHTQTLSPMHNNNPLHLRVSSLRNLPQSVPAQSATQEESIFTGLFSAFDNLLSVFNPTPTNTSAEHHQKSSSQSISQYKPYAQLEQQINQPYQLQDSVNNSRISANKIVDKYLPLTSTNHYGRQRSPQGSYNQTIQRDYGVFQVNDNYYRQSDKIQTYSNQHTQFQISKIYDDDYKAIQTTSGNNNVSSHHEFRKGSYVNNQTKIFPYEQHQIRSKQQKVSLLNSRLSNYNSRWVPSIHDHEASSQMQIETIQFLSITNDQENCAISISLSSKPQPHCLGEKGPIKYQANIQIGSIAVEYNNPLLRLLSENLVLYKNIHALRYIPLFDIISGKFNRHRRLSCSRQIELLTPLYLIKKIFISKHTVPSERHKHKEVQGLVHKKARAHRNNNIQADLPSPTQSRQISFKKAEQEQLSNTLKERQNPKRNLMSNNNNKRSIVGEDIEEEENITEEEEKEQAARKNIMDAVCSKKSSQSLSGSNKKKNAYENSKPVFMVKDGINKESYLDKVDQILLKKLIDYEKKNHQVEIEISIDLKSVDIVLLSNNQGAIARLLIDSHNPLEFYKTQNELGFQAFGIQFQTINKIEGMVKFVQVMKSSLQPYLSHPLFVQSEETNFQPLREIIKRFLFGTSERAVQAQNNSNTEMAQGQLHFQNSQVAKIANHLSQGNPLQGIGKTPVQKNNHYNVLFANLSSNEYSNQTTPKLSYMDHSGLTSNNLLSSQTKHFQQEIKFTQQKPSHRDEEVDLDQRLQVQFTDEDENTFRGGENTVRKRDEPILILEEEKHVKSQKISAAVGEILSTPNGSIIQQQQNQEVETNKAAFTHSNTQIIMNSKSSNKALSNDNSQTSKQLQKKQQQLPGGTVLQEHLKMHVHKRSSGFASRSSQSGNQDEEETLNIQEREGISAAGNSTTVTMHPIVRKQIFPTTLKKKDSKTTSTFSGMLTGMLSPSGNHPASNLTPNIMNDINSGNKSPYTAQQQRQQVFKSKGQQ